MITKEPNRILLLISIVYLFFNSVLLPDGLLYTTLLTPFFFMHLVQYKGARIYLVFLLLSLLFAVVQYPDVAYVKDYALSFVLLQCVAIFSINAYYVLRREEAVLPSLFKSLATVNMVLLGFSLLSLPVPFLRSWTWYQMSMSEGLPVIARLKMFTYEASYYSLIIVPLFAYYFLSRSLAGAKAGILLLTLSLSLLLSLSFGVLACLLVSIFLVYFLNLKELGRRINLNMLALVVALLVAGLLLAAWLYPHNQVFERIQNIAAGKDTSAKGRTTESFMLAWNIAKMKSVYFGIGPGQLKMIGRDYIIQYYKYSDIPDTTRIPNAVAETLNIYGIAGLVIRFGLILFGFIRTKVWQNYYRLLLFIFIFIYQFTGSFLFNIAEYILWILAFMPGLFAKFDRVHFLKTDQVSR